MLTKQMFSWLLPLLPAATLGALEFSLLYDQENSNLQCTIIRAKVCGDPGEALGFLRDKGGVPGQAPAVTDLWQ